MYHPPASAPFSKSINNMNVSIFGFWTKFAKDIHVQRLPKFSLMRSLLLANNLPMLFGQEPCSTANDRPQLCSIPPWNPTATTPNYHCWLHPCRRWSHPTPWLASTASIPVSLPLSSAFLLVKPGFFGVKAPCLPCADTRQRSPASAISFRGANGNGKGMKENGDDIYRGCSLWYRGFKYIYICIFLGL